MRLMVGRGQARSGDGPAYPGWNAKGRADAARPFALLGGRGLLGLDGLDVDGLAAALGAELHRAGNEREQGVVAAAAHAVAGVEVRATLTDSLVSVAGQAVMAVTLTWVSG